MTLFHSFFQQVKRTWQWGAQRYLAFSVLCFGAVQNALAAGPDASKIPDFKIPGIDSNTTDPLEIVWIVFKGVAVIAAVCIAALCILVVAKSLIKTYNQATEEGDKKGWTPFIIALIVGFVMIFFTLWLVKMAIGLF
ncbi:DUF2976 family protein [Nicoletella semolina]|uniref:DUF2976 family protein n=1 Tax=Nicoletella semolina TaxID=271160 RepID=A0A4R2NBF0_9PAST|nr:DUF2976 domain-containing protein [Nicoletella semolina]MDH2924858.1 hypothetical protein [Nicoletella semolina]TCP18397.1 DUF2976 family protein [Nicoletella semolina]